MTHEILTHALETMGDVAERRAVIAFTVPGKPQPWRRARLNGSRHFIDPKTAANEAAWAWAARAAMGSAGPLAGPLVVEITARFEPPLSASKVQRGQMLAGLRVPAVRPDSDNIAKNLDALNRLAFTDDAQIVDLIVRKRYAALAGVDVVIRPYVSAVAA